MIRPAFTELAKVYDELMSDVDYRAWCDFILATARARGFGGGPVLDLGCGTGTLALLLSEAGLDVCGLDGSRQMLRRAREKAPELDWRLGSFEGFELDREFELVVSVFDSLNNLLEPEAFLATASNVRRHLAPGGAFLFDLNTASGLEGLWEGDAVTGWAGEIYYRWEATFDPSTRLARVEAYWEDGERNYTEIHMERAYEADEVESLLRTAGFADVEALTYPDAAQPGPDEERIWIFARAPQSTVTAGPA